MFGFQAPQFAKISNPPIEGCLHFPFCFLVSFNWTCVGRLQEHKFAQIPKLNYSFECNLDAFSKVLTPDCFKFCDSEIMNGLMIKDTKHNY